MTEVQVTLEQVQELIQTNEEVRNAVRGEFINAEAFTAFMETEEGKKVLQPEFDRRNTQAINTWKNNNLEKIKQEAILSANPSDTPEQRRIKELELQMKASQEKAVHAEQMSYALGLAQQRGLPQGLVSRFVGKTAEETLQGINSYEMEFKSALQVETEKLLGSTGRNHLPQDFAGASQQATAPVKDVSEMSYQEAAALYLSNPQEYQRLYG
ncbi:hypothetical protein PSYJYH_000062 [Bacillus phage PSYJ-YH]|nr:hypothetical protein PSYJYH_000062 [Bacillus phage PSYJ-YH]